MIQKALLDGKPELIIWAHISYPPPPSLINHSPAVPIINSLKGKKVSDIFSAVFNIRSQICFQSDIITTIILLLPYSAYFYPNSKSWCILFNHVSSPITNARYLLQEESEWLRVLSNLESGAPKVLMQTLAQ